MWVDNDRTGETQQATTPNRALRDWCAAKGYELASHTGRRGELADGRRVCAYLVPAGRVDYPDARTTRSL